MTLVVGLGNPGSRYVGTRHNVGALVLDRLAGPGACWHRQYRGLFLQSTLGGKPAGLLKPSTYMNRSGESVGEAALCLRVATESVLIVHDELDLPFGAVRLKLGGGEAGHRGLLSVTQGLGTNQYGRLRIGIGRPPDDFAGSGADYVLEAFPPELRAELLDVLDRAADAVVQWVQSGWQHAMNLVNRRPPT